MEGIVGQIRLFAGNFIPDNWLLCDGRELSLSTFKALYAVIGQTYGGRGNTTFALPDLRSRTVIGVGPTYAAGTKVGTESNVLTVENLPTHSHEMACNNTVSESLNNPSDAFMSAGPIDRSTGRPTNLRYAPTADGVMNTDAIGGTGDKKPIANIQPSLGLSYIICYKG